MKHYRRYILLGLILMSFLMMVSCGGGVGDGYYTEAEYGRVYISLGGGEVSVSGIQSIPSDITSVVVTCTGPEMEPVTGEVPLDGTPLVLEIPAGPDRLFTAEAYAGNVLRMRGEALVSYIYAGATTSVIIFLHDLATITITPTNVEVQVGESQQFTAVVTAHPDTSVIWSVNGIVGGDATVGSIDATGLYTAPETVPVPPTVTVRATSNADPDLYAEATVTIVEPPVPITVTVSPSIVSLGANQVQQFTATVTGTTNTAVTWSVEDISCGAEAGTIDSNGLYTAGNPSETCQVRVRARSVEDPTKSGTALVTIKVISVNITVTVTPSTATVPVNKTQQFTATVTGTTNTAVTWYVNNIEGGDATVGTIDVDGLYTAPATVPTPSTVTIKAVSQEDPSAFGTAEVTIVFTDYFSLALGGSDYDEAYSVEQTTDGGYIVVGRTSSFGAGGDMWLVKLDANGTIEWEKAIGGGFDDYAYSVEQTTDGGYIVVGRTSSFGAGGDMWLVKLDANGTIEWEKALGGVNWDYAYSVEQTTDGGYIIAGYTLSFGVGGDMWIVKLDAKGEIVFNPGSGASIVDTNATVTDTNATTTTTKAGITDTTDATVTDTKATVTDTNATVTVLAP